MGTNITGIGNANAIGFKSRVTGGAYFPPELKDALVGVWSAYGKSNDSTDRNIIKNKIKDKGGDFVISNAAFKLNSGFGLYAADFLDWISSKDAQKTSFEVKITSSNYKENWVAYKAPNTTFKAMKVRISGIPDGGYLQFFRTTADGGGIKMVNGINEIPAFTNTVVAGFYIDIPLGFDWSNLVIEQIPSFEGAFVTDGIDDLITSTKTVQDMLGGSNEITVVSMIHQISSNLNNLSYTNSLPINGVPKAPLRNKVVNTGKTGIYGYTYKNNVVSTVNNILGDKNDYEAAITGENQLDDRFEITRKRYNSSVAWYWTFIAKKALTTDQINQVIAYFNLDRTLKPDILCNTIKQGITNENHAEFGDKLIDFSGNGRDIQLNNLAWDGDSGIGKYNYPNWKVTATIANTYSTIVNYPTVNGTYSINVNGVSELMQSIGLHLEIKYTTSTGIIYKDIKQDGVYSYILPDGATDLTLRFGGIPGIVNEPCNIIITQIPSHAGALCLDGVNDFGKVTGMPIYKDYTVIADYIRTSAKENAQDSPILSKSQVVNNGAFVFNYLNINSALNSYSFGTNNGLESISDSERKIYYQSKYVNDGKSINSGTGTDYNSMWLGTYRDNTQIFFDGAIYSLMSFPYSMSEFLIERQLKKHKLGTLYPDMVEFRPIVKSNSEYSAIGYLNYSRNLATIKVGDYISIGDTVAIRVVLGNTVDEVVNCKVNGQECEIVNVSPKVFDCKFTITSKSPQKINITIDEYIRFEDIVQPYPVLLRFKDENGNEVSWGGKFKVGSTITRIGSIADPESNLLNGLYSISGLSLNGKAVTSSTSIVEKQMVFRTTATWLLDDNEPKVILSPSRLRIPNSSYKILGYIPDISGHGNHGVIHNSAYVEGSGVNEDGSYQFDGVDDFVTIPTLSSGGKQVLMKVNLPRLNEIIYDQRKEQNTYTFAILTTPSQIAYDQRNSERITYIDGILNTNIIAEQLMGVTHNIVVINSKANLDNTRSPILGRDINGNNWSRMRIYDFMLFDKISTDDKIKELNEYIGLSGNIFEFNPPTFTIDLPMAIKSIRYIKEEMK